jgi:hypothetical protein
VTTTALANTNSITGSRWPAIFTVRLISENDSAERAMH